MLTNDERQSLEQEIARYPNLRAASIDCLVMLQKLRGGWLSDEALADLAPLLDMSTHELDALATFYNRLHRRPVGRHLVTYCDSVSCWVMGCDRLRAELERRLGVAPGGTTADGRFTLLPTQCLGHCEDAPVLSIDDEPQLDITPEDLTGILERYE